MWVMWVIHRLSGPACFSVLFTPCQQLPNWPCVFGVLFTPSSPCCWCRGGGMSCHTICYLLESSLWLPRSSLFVVKDRAGPNLCSEWQCESCSGSWSLYSGSGSTVSQGWEFAHSLIAHLLICSFCSNQMSDCERFALIAQDKWARLWANHSFCSRQMSDREWLAHVAQVAHDKWATERFPL